MQISILFTRLANPPRIPLVSPRVPFATVGPEPVFWQPNLYPQKQIQRGTVVLLPLILVEKMAAHCFSSLTIVSWSLQFIVRGTLFFHEVSVRSCSPWRFLVSWFFFTSIPTHVHYASSALFPRFHATKGVFTSRGGSSPHHPQSTEDSTTSSSHVFLWTWASPIYNISLCTMSVSEGLYCGCAHPIVRSTIGSFPHPFKPFGRQFRGALTTRQEAQEGRPEGTLSPNRPTYGQP